MFPSASRQGRLGLESGPRRRRRTRVGAKPVTAAIAIVAFTVAAVTLLAVGIHRRNEARWVPAPKPRSPKAKGPVRIVSDQRVFDWETDG